MIRDPSDGSVREKLKQWFCTDCGDNFSASECGRCPMCGGARVIGPVIEEPASPVRTAREIYTKAEQGARKEHARMVRRFVAGKIDVCPCGMDMERDAIIEAFAQIIEKGQ